MKRISAVIALVAMITPSMGLAQSVDWKMYGWGSDPDGDNFCFYEAKGLDRRADDHIRVWTKCLLQKDLDSVNIKNDYGGKILENSAQKALKPYIPPIARVEDVDYDKSITISLYEETANIADLKEHMRIFYEFDCRERRVRELSMYIYYSGKTGSRRTPNEWAYVPPEGNGARLLKLLCPLP